MNEAMWKNLLDKNMDKRIVKCYICNQGRFKNRISVTYSDKNTEIIFTYNPAIFHFESGEIVGKTKLEAVFYCDRKISNI